MKDTLPDSGFFTEDLASPRPRRSSAPSASELGRQRDEIELIASENIVSRAVLEAQGSVMTNKYAEGYPGPALLRRLPVRRRRRDPGDRARLPALRREASPTSRPNSGSQANQAVFLALLQPGDTFLAMDLSAGGHLTHGAKPNMSGKWFKPVHYGVRKQDQRLDYDAVAELAARAPAEAHHRRRLGDPAPDRLRPLPRDRRRASAPT